MELNRKYSHLILCLAAIVLFSFVQDTCAREEKPDDQNMNEAIDHYVTVYYFHGNNRCFTCKKIERLTREAVLESFNDEITSGLIKLQVVNVDEPENKHFEKHYQLFTRSVVVSDIKSGKEKQWKNLQKVWELVQNDEAFKEYIRNEIEAYLS